MIQSYDELIGKIQELFKGKEDYNGFILTDPDCCQVCREEKNGFRFMEVQDAFDYDDVCALLISAFVCPSFYTETDLLELSTEFGYNFDDFKKLPQYVQMECAFEELYTGERLLEKITIDDAYNKYLNLLNTEYKRKEAIA